MSSNTKPILYGMVISPPVRSVLLTLKALNLDYEFREINLITGENKSPEFLKKNPQHTVPVLEVDGKFITDSHAIITYLARRYNKNNASLYPNDYYERAIVDQRLHFNSGVLLATCAKNTTGAIMLRNPTKEQVPAMITLVHEQYNMLDTFLANHKYVAGDNLTIADFSIIATITYLICLTDIDADKQPNLAAWFKRIKQLPYYEEACGKGAEMIDSFFQKQFAQLK